MEGNLTELKSRWFFIIAVVAETYFGKAEIYFGILKYANLSKTLVS